jgi:hypothetical protein
MQLFKKYSAMFVPAGIVLAAVVLLVATMLMGASLKKQMASSIQQQKSLKDLLNSAVSLKQVELERAYQDAHKQDAEAFVEFGRQGSQRELLAYNMFPAPDANETSNTIFHDFARAYSKAIDNLISRMKAGQPYSPMEMAAATRSASSGDASGGKLTDVLAKRRAELMQIYCDPYAFAGYDYGRSLVVTNRARALTECWYRQLAYWIQEDIAETIIAVNSAARNVLDSPVKRLMAVSFAVPEAASVVRTGKTGFAAGSGYTPSYGEGGGVPGPDAELPQYVTTASDQFASPPLTGRISNDYIDVVHFSFAVVLRSSALIPFTKQLCSEKKHLFRGFDGKAAQPTEYVHNAITVLDVTAVPVDLTVDEAMFYRYGDDALYRVNYVCEYVFNRSGYDAIKPDVVKAPPKEQTVSE